MHVFIEIEKNMNIFFIHLRIQTNSIGELELFGAIHMIKARHSFCFG